MAEFVEKRCEDMIPELEQMERVKLFDKNEIRTIAKKRKEYEYKIQRHTKNKEDFLKYIQYEMDLLKLISQRRGKFGITAKKSDIDYSIANKVNKLYKQAIFRFQDDVRFWISYMKFCKNVRFHSCVSRMIGRMLQVHQNKPRCWHLAARWELDENKSLENARKFILRGLHFHPESQLLYSDAFEFELKAADSKIATSEDKSEASASSTTNESETPIEIQRALIIYEQALKTVKDINFIINLLNIAKNHEKTEKLQNKIISEMIQEYSNKPQMWDTMARRELEGLTYVDEDDEMEIEKDEEPSSPRDRIASCIEVYQTGVKRLKTETMWSLYIECLIEINQDMSTLPNYKRKLLKNAFTQAHQAKKLQEKYYLHWIEMLNSDKQDENSKEKLYQVLNFATEAIPQSVNLWITKMEYLLKYEQDSVVQEAFSKAIKSLGSEALPLWKMNLLYCQAKCPERVEEIFQAVVNEDPVIAKEMRAPYLEWLVLTKGIQKTRQKYQALSVQPPTCLELHTKMADLELLQPTICMLYARKPHEMATLQFGKTNTKVWIDYIAFEMKHGEPIKVADIHRRAVKTLEKSKVDSFITEFTFLKANPDSILNTTS